MFNLVAYLEFIVVYVVKVWVEIKNLNFTLNFSQQH